jgi:hypothetical protein
MVRVHPDPPLVPALRARRYGDATGFGGVAQLGEHLLCKQGVIGSIPFTSTIAFVRGLKSGYRALILNAVPKVASARRAGHFRFEHSNDRLFFNNLVVVDMLFLCRNNNVIASNKCLSKFSSGTERRRI